jgi:hypothetical protein
MNNYNNGIAIEWLTSPCPAAEEHSNTRPQASCAPDRGSSCEAQLQDGDVSEERELPAQEKKWAPFCFTLSNETTRSDSDPGNAAAVDR